MLRRVQILAAAIAAPIALTVVLRADDRDSGAAKPQYAGKTERGFLLPNGWTISPAGEQVALTDLPLNIIPLDDGRHALAASSGYNAHNLVLVDLFTKNVVATETVRQSWFGLAFHEKTGQCGGQVAAEIVSTRLLSTGRRLPERVSPSPHRCRESEGRARLIRSGADRPRQFRSGLTVDPAAANLFTLDINNGTIIRQPLDGNADKPTTAQIAERPYDVTFDRHGRRLYVSDWADRAVVAVSPRDLRVLSRIAVGEHPNQLAVHPKDDRIFVACASSNCVSVIDTLRGVVTETIFTALFPLAPEGSTPDALAVAPDGNTLYVANADNNCVAVIDIQTPNRSQVKGFIPTGWYPTSIAVTPDGKNVLVGVGKGNQTKPNPIDPVATVKSETGQPFEAEPGKSSGACSRTSARRSRGPYQSSPYRTTRNSPPTPKPFTRTVRTRTSCSPTHRQRSRRRSR